jgi:hypothetical protein
MTQELRALAENDDGLNAIDNSDLAEFLEGITNRTWAAAEMVG